MKEQGSHRLYFGFSPTSGYPAQDNVYYECLKCGDVVPSRPSDSIHCKCRNIMIDVDYGRIKIQEPAQVRMFSVPG